MIPVTIKLTLYKEVVMRGRVKEWLNMLVRHFYQSKKESKSYNYSLLLKRGMGKIKSIKIYDNGFNKRTGTSIIRHYKSQLFLKDSIG